MEELLKQHRREQRDLQSRITQKKKNATKKTRKGVNDECEKLEQELRAKQTDEIASLNQRESATAYEDVESLDITLATDAEGHGQKIKNRGREVEATATSPTPASGTSPDAAVAQKKPNRQKARLARRAVEAEAAAAGVASEASGMVDYRAREQASILASLKDRNLVEHQVRSDGHCLYAAFADQLRCLDIGIPGAGATGATDSKDDFRAVRQVAGDYVDSHREDFEAFLEEDVESYVRKVKDTAEWGGQVELLALARAFGVTANVLQGDGPVVTVEAEDGKNKGDAWLAYYRHSFGLGEHYNSLRKVT